MYINLITIDLCPGQGGGGVKPSGSLEISENGVYDVYSYASASVDVHPSASLSETYISNGNYNITGEFNGGVIKVDVPAPQFVTETLNVSANGTYNPGEGIDGYSKVVVDVPQSVTGFTEKEITEGVQIVNLSNSASYVHPFVFEKNNYLQTVYLPNCTSIGENAFATCNNLTTVNLPNCEYIGQSVFSYCTNLITVDLTNVKYIGEYAFLNCNTLSNISLPNVEHIDSAAFVDCSSLSNISLPNVKSIGNRVFQYCGNIAYAYIPLVTTLTSDLFNGCYKLSSIYIEHCYNIQENALVNTIITEAIYPECYEVGGEAFINCSSLQRVSLPNLFKFGDPWGDVFKNDVSLEELTLNMNNYLDFASRYTSFRLDNTKLASGIGSIYVQSWHYDKYITANGWSSLSERFVSVPVSSMLSFSNGVLSGYTNIIDSKFNSYIGVSYSEVINVDLPSCKYISSSTFRNCSGLTNVSLPNCKYIGYYAFAQLRYLQNINIPNVEKLKAETFTFCSALTSVSLQNCKYVMGYAFNYCEKLSSLNLPICEYIGGYAFQGAGLITLTLGSNKVVSVSNNAFYNMFNLSSIYVPASLVDAYKSATGFSYLSSKIFPIE